METNGPESIDLKRILAGREDQESFYWFLDEVASVVVGLNVAEQVKFVKLPCDWLSSSLEAFSLLCVENYFERIQSEVKKDARKAEPKWTSDGRGSKKNQGWKQDGIKRYNDLVEKVRQDRASRRKVDELYLGKKQEERMRLENEKLLKRQQVIAGREKELLAAKDDFSDSESEQQ